MSTFYNRKDMGAACSPVTVGDCFKFNHYNCIVTELYNHGFAYDYMNPSYTSGDNRKLISFVYWQANVFYPHPYSQPILKGDKSPFVLRAEYHKRALRRFKEKVNLLSI